MSIDYVRGASCRVKLWTVEIFNQIRDLDHILMSPPCLIRRYCSCAGAGRSSMFRDSVSEEDDLVSSGDSGITVSLNRPFEIFTI